MQVRTVGSKYFRKILKEEMIEIGQLKPGDVCLAYTWAKGLHGSDCTLLSLTSIVPGSSNLSSVKLLTIINLKNCVEVPNAYQWIDLITAELGAMRAAAATLVTVIHK